MLTTLTKMIIVAAIIAAIISVGAAFGQTADWKRLRTDNFEFIGNAADTDIHAVARRLEQFRTALGAIFPKTRTSSATRTRVMVFRDEGSFRNFKPRLNNNASDDIIAGYFQTGQNVNYIAVAAHGSGQRFGTIYHEYVHSVLHESFGLAELPPWLDEGLAEYLQELEFVDGRMRFAGRKRAAHLSLLRKGPLVPWSEFFATDNYALHQRGNHSRTMFYSQAWALVSALVERDAAGSPADGLVRSISPERIMKSVRETPIETLDALVRTYIGQDQAQSMELSLAVTDEKQFGDATPLTEAAANAYLGDLLYHIRDPAAESYLLRSLAAEPEQSMAKATLGMIRLRERKFDDARRFLEMAASVDRSDHLVHYYNAYLISREHMDEFGAVSRFPADAAGKMRESLRRAIALDPNFAESYKLLAFVGVVTISELDDALDAIKKGMALRPGDAEYALLAARLHLMKEQPEPAKTFAEAASRNTKDRFIRDQSLDLIKAADELTKALAQNRAVTIELQSSSFRQPLILQRKDLTEDEVARIDEEREIVNLNYLIDRARADEILVLGRIERITCSTNRINYRIRTDTGLLNLSGRSFDDLRVRVLLAGTRAFSFRCDTRFPSELAAIAYVPVDSQHPVRGGELRSVSFVPKNFKIKSVEELDKMQPIIIEGRTPTVIKENERKRRLELAEKEAVELETRIRSIEDRLKDLEEGEKRIIGVPQKVECVEGRMIFTIKTENAVWTFEASTAPRSVLVRSFTPETGIFEIGCRSQLPDVTAVITYREPAESGVRPEITAIEFVPKIFKLR